MRLINNFDDLSFSNQLWRVIDVLNHVFHRTLSRLPDLHSVNSMLTDASDFELNEDQGGKNRHWYRHDLALILR